MKDKQTLIPLARLALYCMLLRQALFLFVVIAPGNDLTLHGWMAPVYFIAAAIAYGSLYIILKNEIQGVPGHLGVVLLLLSAAGLLAATFFAPGQGGKLLVTWQAGIHNTGEIITLIAIPIAAMLINLDLALRNPGWAKADDILLWTSFTPIIGLVVLTGYMFITVISKGQHVDSKILRHALPAGAVFLLYDAWAAVVAWQYLKHVNKRR